MRQFGVIRLPSTRRGKVYATAIAAVTAVAVAVGTWQVTAAAWATGGPRSAQDRVVAATGEGKAREAEPRPCPPVPGQPTGGSPRIMIVGDSITSGSSGDYTWQYRLYQHLRADGVSPQMVGPYGWLYNNVTRADGDCSYADPMFERANDAYWGMPLWREESAIKAKVAKYRPDYLLELLGVDDFAFFGKTQPQMASYLAGFIGQARAANPHIRIALGIILPDSRTQDSATFAARAQTAARIRTWPPSPRHSRTTRDSPSTRGVERLRSSGSGRAVVKRRIRSRRVTVERVNSRG